MLFMVLYCITAHPIWVCSLYGVCLKSKTLPTYFTLKSSAARRALSVLRTKRAFSDVASNTSKAKEQSIVDNVGTWLINCKKNSFCFSIYDRDNMN